MFHSVSPAFGGLYRYILVESDKPIDPEAFAADLDESLSMTWADLQAAEQDSFEPIRKVLPNATKIKLVVDSDEGDMYIAADDDNGQHATPYLDLDTEHIGAHYDSIQSIIRARLLDDEDYHLPAPQLEAYNEQTNTLFKKQLQDGTHGMLTQIEDSVTFTSKHELEN
jgi:hypothetical protein